MPFLLIQQERLSLSEVDPHLDPEKDHGTQVLHLGREEHVVAPLGTVGDVDFAALREGLVGASSRPDSDYWLPAIDLAVAGLCFEQVLVGAVVGNGGAGVIVVSRAACAEKSQRQEHEPESEETPNRE
jgi:hypothetical protein